jgi:excisionase family DNA binding protein
MSEGMTDNPGPKAAFTIKQFCSSYGIGRSTFYEELKAGRLRARKAGGRTLVLAEDASAWAKSLPEAGASA